MPECCLASRSRPACRKDRLLRTRTLLLLGAGLVVALSACASDDDEPSAPTTTTTRATTTTASAATLTVDWTGSFETALPNGWTIRDCEGARTNVCVYDGEAFLGDIELLAGYPLSPEDHPTNPQAVAEDWARDMISQFQEDRASGCADFTFTPLEVTEADVGGRLGARGGFVLRSSTGAVVEHVVNHYVVVDGSMSIINTDAYARDAGCLPPSDTDPSFTPDDLARLDDGLLDRIVAGSPATAS